MNKSVSVPADSPLLEFLFRTFPGQKKTKTKQMLKYGSVRVNGQVVTRHSHVLKPGDVVDFLSIREAGVERMKTYLRFRVVHEDEHLIVVDKPERLLTVATDEEKEKTLYFELTGYMREKSPDRRGRVFVVHRLDRDASGLLVFAKSEEVKHTLQESWHLAVKRYLAVAEGTPAQKSGTIRSDLVEDRSRRVRSTEGRSGQARPSVTHYRVLRAGGGYSLLEITLDTGRKNQIRVHLSDLGHPIAGDFKYGAKTNPLRRLALHASRLSFKHPVTGKFMSFQSDIPDGFEDLIP